MPKTIIAVDDDPIVTGILQSGLTQRGYSVHVTNRGKDALKLIKMNPPDLVILDILMPDMDGTEVARLLKQDSKTCDIPVIFLTVLGGNEEHPEGAIEFGTTIVLGKPVEIDELVEKIHSLIGE